MKKFFFISIKFLISVALIWMLLSEIDLLTAFERLKTIILLPLSFVLLVFIAQMNIGGARWGFVLKAIGAPLKFINAIKLFYIGTEKS